MSSSNITIKLYEILNEEINNNTIKEKENDNKRIYNFLGINNFNELYNFILKKTNDSIINNQVIEEKEKIINTYQEELNKLGLKNYNDFSNLSNIYNNNKNKYENINNINELLNNIIGIQNNIYKFLEENGFEDINDLIKFVNKYK